MRHTGKRVLIQVLALLAITCVACTAAKTPFAANSLTDKVLVNENFTKFDQKLGSGWRTVMLQMKYSEAADFIEQYQLLHSKTLLKWQKASLAYHLGVVYSLANERQKAIYWFHQALASKLLGNPAYINAHIAFEAGNKEALLQARDKIAALAQSEMRSEDLGEIDAMIKYFEQPFEAAFGALNCLEKTPPHSPGWRNFCKVIHSKYDALYQRQINGS